MTREEALREHREMWEAMQEELGDYPDFTDRLLFKRIWCRARGDYNIENHCYLCQYRKEHGLSCGECLINWGGSGCVYGNTKYDISPISEILALPEREGNDYE